MVRLVLSVMLALAACGQTPEREVETRILCVWDSAPPGLLADEALARVRTPQLYQWSRRAAGKGLFVLKEASGNPSMSSAFADVLTGAASEQHGLRSVAELGAQTLASDVHTIAQDLPGAFVTLASVSEAHFALQGVTRGIETWKAPALASRRVTRNAGEVWEAIEPPLADALASDDPVFLVLFFSDLRGDRWRQAKPSREMLEQGLQRWIGKGGEIDNAFAERDSEWPLVQRLGQVLLRRKGDPRCIALEAILRDTGLRELDAVLGELQGLLEEHGRLGSARLELDRGRTAGSAHVAGQAIEVTSELDHLRSKVLVGTRARPADAPGRVSFEARATEFRLRLEDPQLFTLNPKQIGLGALSLASADVPELPSKRSKPWPENALVGPVLDLQNAGGRRLACTIDAAQEARVELLLESFPADEEWLADFAVPGATLERHALRPGAVWIRARGPLAFSLPARSPTARLGVVLRIEGQRVSGSRMRYLTRVFSASDSLTLGFSAGCWLQAPLRGALPNDLRRSIEVQLVDALPLRSSIRLPSPSALAALRRLDRDE